MVSRQQVSIRPANAAEDWAVHQLFHALHTLNAALDPRFALAEGWSRVLDEHLASVRATGEGLTLLAWEASRPAGLLMMGVHTDSMLFRHRHWVELLALYVAPQGRGDGIGDQLLDAGLDWARERGHRCVQLFVTASNVPAKRFYERMGFRPTQEIWRLELGESNVVHPHDHAHSHEQLRAQELLSTGANQMLGNQLYSEPE